VGDRLVSANAYTRALKPSLSSPLKEKFFSFR
jgi:hypothetical protein